MANEKGKSEKGGVLHSGGSDNPKTSDIASAIGARKEASTTGVKTGRPSNAELEARRATALDKMFSTKNFKELVKVPGLLAASTTGFMSFKLSDDEAEALAISTSETARYFIDVDPKWFALGMMMMNFGMIYGTKTAQYYSERSKHDKVKMDEKKQS